MDYYQCPYYLIIILLSYSVYSWYLYNCYHINLILLAGCFFTHLLMLWITVVFTSICLQIMNLSNNHSRLFYYSDSFVQYAFCRLLFMVKAFFTRTFICHTTNILSFKFWIVQWFKASLSFYFQNTYNKKIITF